MELTLDQPGDQNFVRAITAEGIQVGDETYVRPFIVNAETLIPDWPVSDVRQIMPTHLEPVFELEPEVVIIGTGARQVFLEPDQMMLFYNRNVGFEVMATDAACRTFNVLVSELRNVAAILIPAQSPNGSS